MIDIIFVENAEPLPIDYIQLMEGLIGEAEKDKASRYRRWQDKQAYLLGKLLVARFLMKYNYEKNLLKQLMYTEFKRPFIEAVDADFNISHSGEIVVCAFSPDQKIGIDIEQIHDVKLSDFQYILNEKDEQKIESATDKMAVFFKIWSAKEAILKAEGCGLVDDLYKLEVDGEKGYFNNATYHLLDLKMMPGYSSCLATSSAIDKFTIKEMSIDQMIEEIDC